MKRSTIKSPNSSAILVLFLAILAGCEVPAGCVKSATYAELKIDLETLEIKPVGLLNWEWWVNPRVRHQENEYSRFTDGRGRQGVSHLIHAPPDSKHRSLNSFSLDENYRLLYRSKRLEILRGDFGTVYSKVSYYYGDKYEGQGTRLSTFNYSNGRGEPLSISDPPSDDHSLVAISVVRIFRSGPDFMISSANYTTPDGDLEQLHGYGTQDGDRVSRTGPSPPAGILWETTHFRDHEPTRSYFGLPKYFPIDDYLATPKSVFLETKLDVHLNVVNLHYDLAHFTRQDFWENGELASQRWLSHRWTKEDRVLEPIDRLKPFRGRLE